MTIHRLTEGTILGLRVNDGPWQTLVFDAAAELQGATSSGNENGETAVPEADPVASTAAALPPTASMTVDVDGKATFGDEEHQQRESYRTGPGRLVMSAERSA